jgi:hypothetical protein
VDYAGEMTLSRLRTFSFPEGNDFSSEGCRLEKTRGRRDHFINFAIADATRRE